MHLPAPRQASSPSCTRTRLPVRSSGPLDVNRPAITNWEGPFSLKQILHHRGPHPTRPDFIDEQCDIGGRKTPIPPEISGYLDLSHRYRYCFSFLRLNTEKALPPLPGFCSTCMPDCCPINWPWRLTWPSLCNPSSVKLWRPIRIIIVDDFDWLTSCNTAMDFCFLMQLITAEGYMNMLIGRFSLRAIIEGTAMSPHMRSDGQDEYLRGLCARHSLSWRPLPTVPGWGFLLMNWTPSSLKGDPCQLNGLRSPLHYLLLLSGVITVGLIQRLRERSC
uniref:Coenzyme PQQ synthesis protein E n=1 Tax=Klebsiella pneumoniae TaxID=573 RepID=B6VAA8_KLEPN|nr:coenzyme PQQ synthesis protein E [Klebsiella pneumoniae]